MMPGHLSTIMSCGVFFPSFMTALTNNRRVTSDNEEVLDLSMKKHGQNRRKRRYSDAPMSSDESNTEEDKTSGGSKKPARKLELKELTTSPVSGTIIRDPFAEIPTAIQRGE